MRCVLGVVAAVALGAASIEGAAEEPSAPLSPIMPTFLAFSGADLWHSGWFVHGGVLWSPHGIENEGFVVKLLTGAGVYRYTAGSLGGATVTGTQALLSAMPGWRFKYEKFELTAYGGLDLQNHFLSPDDPGSSLQGLHGGVRVGADLWYEPLAPMMIAANVSLSSIGPSYWSRLAGGWRVLDAAWVGPELQAMGGPTYQQFRAGVHATALRTGAFEWSAGIGYAIDSDDRSGFYGRLGVLTRR